MTTRNHYGGRQVGKYHYSLLGVVFATLILLTELANAQQGPLALQSLRSRIPSTPTVSPYLSLLANQQTGLPTYFTRVRPQLEAQRRAREQDRQNDQLQRLQSQVNTVRRDLTRSQQNTGVFPTGHPTRFANYSHYYPTLNRR